MGALALQDKMVGETSKDYGGVKYHISWDTVLDQHELDRIRADRYSRKPVISHNNQNIVVGVLLAKSLIGVRPGSTLRELYVRKHAKVVLPYYTGPDVPITKCIAGFEESGSHMGFVLQSED
jgi:CBS domain containing-hemolysin-like protein